VASRTLLSHRQLGNMAWFTLHKYLLSAKLLSCNRFQGGDHRTRHTLTTNEVVNATNGSSRGTVEFRESATPPSASSDSTATTTSQKPCATTPAALTGPSNYYGAAKMRLCRDPAPQYFRPICLCQAAGSWRASASVTDGLTSAVLLCQRRVFPLVERARVVAKALVLIPGTRF